MNFGRISERLMKLAVSMNYLKLMRLFLDLFTVLQCQRRAIPTFFSVQIVFTHVHMVGCYTSTWPPFFCFVHQYGRRDVM